MDHRTDAVKNAVDGKKKNYQQNSFFIGSAKNFFKKTTKRVSSLHSPAGRPVGGSARRFEFQILAIKIHSQDVTASRTRLKKTKNFYLFTVHLRETAADLDGFIRQTCYDRPITSCNSKENENVFRVRKAFMALDNAARCGSGPSSCRKTCLTTLRTRKRRDSSSCLFPSVTCGFYVDGRWPAIWGNVHRNNFFSFFGAEAPHTSPTIKSQILRLRHRHRDELALGF